MTDTPKEPPRVFWRRHLTQAEYGGANAFGQEFVAFRELAHDNLVVYAKKSMDPWHNYYWTKIGASTDLNDLLFQDLVEAREEDGEKE